MRRTKNSVLQDQTPWQDTTVVVTKNKATLRATFVFNELKAEIFAIDKSNNSNIRGINPLSANITKRSNTLKQFVTKLPTNCLSVFDHFVGLVLKGSIFAIKSWIVNFTEFILTKGRFKRSQNNLGAVSEHFLEYCLWEKTYYFYSLCT